MRVTSALLGRIQGSYDYRTITEVCADWQHAP